MNLKGVVRCLGGVSNRRKIRAMFLQNVCVFHCFFRGRRCLEKVVKKQPHISKEVDRNLVTLASGSDCRIYSIL